MFEGIVIVTSILLAFALDALWQQRTEASQERVLREALVADFQRVRELILPHREEHVRTQAAVGHFIDLVSDVEPGTSVFIPDTAIVFGILNPSLDVPTGALESALFSGGLQLISDPELRRMLALWPAGLLDATEDDRMLREFHGIALRDELSSGTNLIVPLSRTWPSETGTVTTGVEVLVTNRLKGILPSVLGSSELAAQEEAELLLFVDSILARLGG
jgi:hypothetical protein